MTPGPQKQFDTTLALEKAMHVFWQHGFAGASLSQLLCEMGIGKKSLYDTFGNKRSLFLKALDLYASRSLESVKEKLAQPGPVLKNLKQLFLSFHESECKGCFYGTNMADFDLSDKEVSDRFCLHLKNFENVLTEALERAVNNGEMSPKTSPQKAARLLSCLAQGTALVGRVGECPQRYQDALSSVFELLNES